MINDGDHPLSLPDLELLAIDHHGAGPNEGLSIRVGCDVVSGLTAPLLD